ncbi:MAG TPA: antitoxin VapB family protein [Terrimicrobiaceae bacterium]
MKTITLTDEAYERLKAWKTGKDSFSQVVLRTVAKRGTFGDLDESFKALPPLSEAQSPTRREAKPSGNER